MFEELNEQTTLLAKEKRQNSNESVFENLEHTISGNFAAILDTNESGHRFDWQELRFYLIEPMIILLFFAYNLSATIIESQIIYQTCTTTFGFNASDCKLLGTKNNNEFTEHIETEVQPYAARIVMASTVIQSLVPALCGPFIGAWSDTFGRKPLFLAAFFGNAIYYISAAAIAIKANNSLISPWYFLIAIMPSVILGGSATFSMAAYCYIADLTTTAQRPYRMAIYEAMIYIGLMLGAFAAGFIYEATNATIVFTISAAVLISAIFIMLIFMPESLNQRKIECTNEEQQDQCTEQSQECFNWHLLRELWYTCFRPRPYADRSIIFFSMTALLTSAFVVDGSSTVFYLFIRKRLNWTIKKFTTYETLNIFIPTIGNICGIFFLRKVLKLPLLKLGILAFFSQVCSSFMKGFAFYDWHIYCAIALGALKSIANPMCRTIIANIVPANELGKIFAFYSTLQSLMPLIASPIYAAIYSITLISFPGFFNVFSANLYFLCIGYLLVILCKQSDNLQRYGALLS